MLQDFTQAVLDWVLAYRELGVLLGGLVEAIIIPIPSPLITMSAGFLLVPQRVLKTALPSLFIRIAVPYSLGATVGNLLVYWPTYYAGKFFVDKFSKFLDFSWRDVQLIKLKFDEGTWDEKVTVLLRAVPLLPVSLVTAVGGALRLEWKKFFLLSFLGLVVRGFIMGLVGWWSKDAYMALAEGADKLETYFSIGFLILTWFGFYLLYRNRERWLIGNSDPSKLEDLEG
ncbi:MAG: VTT domain-containing protein [Patescibacteria group bacterium]